MVRSDTSICILEYLLSKNLSIKYTQYPNLIDVLCSCVLTRNEQRLDVLCKYVQMCSDCKFIRSKVLSILVALGDVR